MEVVPPMAPTNPAMVIRRGAPGAPRKQMPVKSRLSKAENVEMKNYENYGNVWTVNTSGPINVGNKNNKSAKAKNISWANRPSKSKGGKRKTVRHGGRDNGRKRSC